MGNNNSSRQKVKNLLKRVGAIVVISAVVLGAKYGISKKEERQAHKYSRAEVAEMLVPECLLKAAGEDRVLSIEESRQMARDLNYRGIFLEGESASLDYDGGSGANLRIGFNDTGEYRALENLSQEVMQQYINTF